MPDELRERLAAIEHERWADWQRWMHSRCERYGDGSLLIPAELVARWERQIATPYAGLSDFERDSDREQVDRYWPLIEELTRKAAAWDRLMALADRPGWAPNVNQRRWFRGLLREAEREADHD